MRLDKFLSACGLGTRTEVKKMIRQKRILVNQILAEKPEQKIDENKDEICLDRQVIRYQKSHYYLFYKPAGCVTAVTDKLHKTVMDYFPEQLRKGCSPVGRLDLDTEGLLLITDDGAFHHHLMSPAHHVEKCYEALLDCPVPEGTVELFQEGIDIGDEKKTLPAKLLVFEPEETEEGSTIYRAHLTLTEGRFHQVKRMFATQGCEVLFLKRIRLGNLTLGDLKPGSYRELTEQEVEELEGI